MKQSVASPHVGSQRVGNEPMVRRCLKNGYNIENEMKNCAQLTLIILFISDLRRRLGGVSFVWHHATLVNQNARI